MEGLEDVGILFQGDGRGKEEGGEGEDGKYETVAATIKAKCQRLTQWKIEMQTRLYADNFLAAENVECQHLHRVILRLERSECYPYCLRARCKKCPRKISCLDAFPLF